jgi:hypothetical protein
LTTAQFGNGEPLPIILRYNFQELLEKSNDSTYIHCELSYESEGQWLNVDAEIRVRGGFRKTYCFFTPLKLKISKESVDGTPFEQSRKVKLVMPCLKSKTADDNLLKELMAYKIFEILSPYHFKTELLEIELEILRNKKSDDYKMLAFMIQDDESFSTMNNAKEIERFMDYKALDPRYRVINALFQFMIGNTDFSTVYLHNEKIFYIDDKIVPVPYDFDMSGLVDASYAVVSQVRNEVLPIEDVTSRLYRGFEADEQLFEDVRSIFIEKEEDVYSTMRILETYFKDPKEFRSAKSYIEGFYDILHDDKKFKRRIVQKGRKK